MVDPSAAAVKIVDVPCYDPTSPNDRLLLGTKRTMSEMELSVFRQRSIEAMKQKAR
jgi:DNA invertase Pin-like site-specific DNA recombinase